MDFEGLVEDVRDWLVAGGWVWVVVGIVLVVAIAVPASLLWPALQPKPAPVYQPAGETTAPATAATPTEVPEDVKKAIMTELGIQDPEKVSMAFSDGEGKAITVTVASGGMQYDRYEFRQNKDGAWRPK